MAKKVLFVATVDSHIELFHVPFLKMFKEKGWEVHVATDTNKKIEACDKKICLPIKRSPFKLISNIRAIRALRKVMREEKYDIVHCHTPMGGVVARMAAKPFRKNGMRVIYTAHGFHFYKGAPLHFWMMFYPVEKYLAKYTDTLITINEEDYDRARKKFGKRCLDIQYVPGVGIDPKKFEKKLSAKKTHELRASLGLKDDDVVLICVGRLDKNKNQGLIIKAMKELVAENSKYHLLLAGTDELGGEYQKLAKKLGVSSNVHFLGFCDNVAELMQISDIAVSASKREGLPMNLVEAAYMRLPIVATDCRGNRDICRMVGGVTFNDVDSFIEAIRGASKTTINKDYLVNCILDRLSKVYLRKKRVLHVLATDRFSGAENVACTIIRNLSDKYDMAYCSPSGPIENKLKEMNIKFYGVKKLSCKNLNSVIREFNPDIIHAHDYRASTTVSFFTYKKSLISHIHLDNPKVRHFGFYAVIYMLCAKRFKKIIWVSKDAFDNFYYRKKLDLKRNSIVLRNVIDEKYIESMASMMSNSSCCKEYDLAFVGRLVEQKNPERVLKIVSQVRKKIPFVKLVIAGDGERFKAVKNAIMEEKLEENVDLLGFVDNPYSIIKRSKILILTSRFEGTPMVVLEAQALGKPVVSANIRGFEEYIINKKNGFLCKTDDDFVCGIVDLLDKKEYDGFAVNTRRFFKKNNSFNEYIRRINNFYEGVYWEDNHER